VVTNKGYRLGEICFEGVHKFPSQLKLTEWDIVFADKWFDEKNRRLTPPSFEEGEQ